MIPTIPNEITLLGAYIITLAIFLTHSYTKFQTWKERAYFTGILILATATVYTIILTINLWRHFTHYMAYLDTHFFQWEMLSVAICVIFSQQLMNLTFISFQLLKKGFDGIMEDDNFIKALKAETIASIAFFAASFIGTFSFSISFGMSMAGSIIISIVFGTIMGSVLGTMTFISFLES